MYRYMIVYLRIILLMYININKDMNIIINMNIGEGRIIWQKLLQ